MIDNTKGKQMRSTQESIEQAKEEAKRTGKDILISSYDEECNLPDCSLDNVDVYITPEGKRKVVRTHNW